MVEGAGFRAELVFRRPQGFQVLASFSAHIEGAKEDIWIIRQEKEIQIMMMMTMVVVVMVMAAADGGNDDDDGGDGDDGDGCC